jgi:hypothetical protein
MPDTTPAAASRNGGSPAKSRLAGLTAHRKPDDPAIDAARAQLREANAERYIRNLVAQAPPLTPGVRARLAVLLLVPDGGSDG